MIVKAWSRNIAGEATTPVYKEKVSLKFQTGFPFKAYLRFLTKKSRQDVPASVQDDTVLSTLP